MCLSDELFCIVSLQREPRSLQTRGQDTSHYNRMLNEQTKGEQRELCRYQDLAPLKGIKAQEKHDGKVLQLANAVPSIGNWIPMTASIEGLSIRYRNLVKLN